MKRRSQSYLPEAPENNWEFKDNYENDIYRSKREIIISLAKMFLIGLTIAAIVVAILVFVVIPLIFMSSAFIQRLAMFTNINLPSNPLEFNVKPIESKNVTFRNFYIQFEDENRKNISLGVWHLLHYNLSSSNKTFKDLDASLQLDKFDVVIYFHGSGETRMAPVPMYQVLIKHFHVIAFDYRDFGDSSNGVLSEEVVAEDALHVFAWVRNRTNRAIYVWGHSLGTPLATLTITKLISKWKPHGLVLEAPMTNMQEELPLHPYGKIFSWLPWFKSTILDPLKENGFLFETDKYILEVDCPIMILHAEDDSIIPYTLGKKLAKIAREQRDESQGNVTYIQISAKFKFNHFRIYDYRPLGDLIRNFTKVCDKFNNTKND